MKHETALDLLKNLLERASSTGEKTFLTSLEIAALQIVLGAGDAEHEVTEAAL